MNRLTAAAILALTTIAMVAGGATVRLLGVLASSAGAATLGFVVLVLLGGLVLGSRSPERGWTTYWY